MRRTAADVPEHDADQTHLPERGHTEDGPEPDAHWPDDWTTPENLIGWTLVQVSNRLLRRFSGIFATESLRPHEFGVLVELTVSAGISQAALARVVLITPQSMGSVLRGMEERGLIRRAAPLTRGSPVAVWLTDAGRATLARAYPAVMAMNRSTALGLTEDEATQLNGLLHRLLRS